MAANSPFSAGRRASTLTGLDIHGAVVCDNPDFGLRRINPDAVVEPAAQQRTAFQDLHLMASAVEPASISAHPMGPWGHFRRLFARTETIRFLTSSNLKAGHRNKILGNVWNLLDPLLLVCVYFLVFGLLFGQSSRARPSSFIAYLVIGVLGWRFHDTVISQAAGCLRSNRGLIHGANFPKAVFPISVCLARLYDFAWGLVVFGGVLLVIGTVPTVHLCWAPLLIVLQLMFLMGCAFIVADLGAFYADTANIVSVTTRLWFYASPIFYQVSGERGLIPEKYLWLYMLNPVACFLENYRSAMIWGQAPNPQNLFYICAISVTTLLVGFALFVRHEGEFAKYV